MGSTPEAVPEDHWQLVGDALAPGYDPPMPNDLGKARPPEKAYTGSYNATQPPSPNRPTSPDSDVEGDRSDWG